MLPGASGPHQLTGQRPGPHVQDPPVVPEARRRQEQRLVVHVQLEDRRVGHVHDRLAGPGERMRPFGVRDRPGLMEPVDERPGNQRRAALLEAAADADESVAKREDGLGQTDELIGVPRLHNAPFVGWVEVLWRQLNFSLEHDPTVNPRTRYRQMAPTAITAIIRPAGPSPPRKNTRRHCPGRETILKTSRCQAGNDMHHACQECNRGQEHARRQAAGACPWSYLRSLFVLAWPPA